jgi:hypothetical protein
VALDLARIDQPVPAPPRGVGVETIRLRSTRPRSTSGEYRCGKALTAPSP